MLRPVKKARKAKKAKKAKPELNLSHLFTFFHDGLGGDAFADDERVRLLPGLVVLLPVVPLPDDLRLGDGHAVLGQNVKFLHGMNS